MYLAISSAMSTPLSDITRAGTAASAGPTRDAVILSIAIVVILTAVVVILIWSVNRKRKVFLDRQRSLYRAGQQTLSLADALAAQVAESPYKLSKSGRRDLEQAAEVRSRAAATLARGGTDSRLAEGNREAAEAMVLLAGLRRRAGIETPAPPARCYYCGREEGQFAEVTIGSEGGPQLTVQACAECRQMISSGATPHLTLAPFYGIQVPWWAVPNNLWFVAYGGEAWQYWLPLVAGQTLESWFAGGWTQGIAVETTPVP